MRHHNQAVEAVRFAITGPALPPVQAVVALGDRLRASCQSDFGAGNEHATSRTLAGKTEGGERLGGAHQHAHYLAFSRLPDARYLDTMVVWAPAKFTETELLAVARTRRLWAPQHVDGVRGRVLGVEAFGSVADAAPELVGPSAVWRSFTPYSPVRRPSRKPPLEHLADDIDHELTYRGLPPRDGPIELVRGDWLSFRRHRPNERLERARSVYGVRLQFAQPIHGPLALGQLSHFGLGLFRPESTT
jgi:CRISPR-associated protein Csb2